MSCSFEAAFSTAPKENNKPKDTPAVRRDVYKRQSALLVKKVEEGMVFVAFPQACSNCGLCADVCYQEAIKVKETGITPEYLKNAPKAILSRGINERLFEDVWEDKLKSMITCPTYRG